MKSTKFSLPSRFPVKLYTFLGMDLNFTDAEGPFETYLKTLKARAAKDDWKEEKGIADTNNPFEANYRQPREHYVIDAIRAYKNLHPCKRCQHLRLLVALLFVAAVVLLWTLLF